MQQRADSVTICFDTESYFSLEMLSFHFSEVHLSQATSFSGSKVEFRTMKSMLSGHLNFIGMIF